MKRIPSDEFSKKDANQVYDEIDKHFKETTRINLYDDFGIQDISLKKDEYIEDGELNEEMLVMDLRKVVAYINRFGRIYIVKQLEINSKYYEPQWKDDFDVKYTLKTIQFDIKGKKKNAFMVMYNNINEFSYRQMSLYPKNREFFSFFQEFPYKILPNLDREIISKFLYHGLNIICNSDNACYDYVLKWLSFIVQSPGKKSILHLF